MLFPGLIFQQQPWPRPVLVQGSQKKIRLRLFSLGASNRIPIPRLLSLSILVSNTINFPLQSRELLHDRIHIVVNSLSLNADRSSHCFNHDGQPCEALDSCSCFSEFFDNPGQSLIQSAEDLLSWFRIGRYLQCPPRKEPLDTRSATSPTRPSCSQLRTFRQGSQVPPNPREDGVNCVERPVDQIHNFSVWRAVQRESLNRRDETREQAGKISAGSEKCVPKKSLDERSDESRFLLRYSDGRVRIWRKEHESMDPSIVSTVQAGGGVMVWGIFSWYTITN